MAEVENLSIVIEVIDSYSSEIDQLIMKLAELEGTVQAVDDIRLDVDVRGTNQLNTLMAKLAALEAMDMGGIGNVGVGGGGMGGIMQMGGAAGGAADDAAESAGLLDLRMSDLHNALAMLVPLIFIFIGALPALIGGVVALGAAAISAAAALMAIAGLGALGFAMAEGDGDIMEGMTEILDDIQGSFMDAFAPMARRLEPVFRDALDGLDRLFQGIANRGDALIELSDQARAFGAFMMDWLPDALENMGHMVEAFSGLFSIIGDGMTDISILQILTSFVAQAADELIIFTALLIDFLPVIFEMSIGFLTVVNAIGFLVAAFGRLLAILPVGSEAIGQFIAAGLAAVTVTLLLSRALGVQAVAGLVSAVQSLGIYIGALLTYIPTVSSATAATMGFALAIGLVTGGISLLLGGVATLGSQFSGLSGDIDKATSSLQSFQAQRDGMTRGANPYANPEVSRGESMGSSRFSGGNVNVTVEGDADGETVRNQTHNAMYRLERRGRRR